MKLRSGYVCIERDDYDEALMEAYVAGVAAGKYRGQPSAVDRIDERSRRAYESSYRKWKIYNGNRV